ncbi:MAG: hypothetical protein ACOX2S_08010 [bacterium]|jgi:hypothetical protein
MKRRALVIELLLIAVVMALTGTWVTPQVYCAGIQAASRLIAMEALPRSNAVISAEAGKLVFFPGIGRGGVMYGFQPASTYVYKDLFNIKNAASKPLRIWYTLEGTLDDWHQHTAGCIVQERMFTVAHGNEASEWLPGPEHKISVGAEEVLGPVHFYFDIPSRYLSGEYNGLFIVHAELFDEEPEDDDNGNGSSGGNGDSKDKDEPEKPHEPEKPEESGLVEEGSGGETEETEQPKVDGEQEANEAPEQDEAGDSLFQGQGRGDLPFTGGNEAAVPILGLMLLGVASWLRRRKG